jgi:hypothetical protein
MSAVKGVVFIMLGVLFFIGCADVSRSGTYHAVCSDRGTVTFESYTVNRYLAKGRVGTGINKDVWIFFDEDGKHVTSHDCTVGTYTRRQ